MEADNEVKHVEEVKTKTEEKEKTAKAVKKSNDSQEKSTFADVEGLAALKAQLEKGDNN